MPSVPAAFDPLFWPCSVAVQRKPSRPPARLRAVHLLLLRSSCRGGRGAAGGCKGLGSGHDHDPALPSLLGVWLEGHRDQDRLRRRHQVPAPRDDLVVTACMSALPCGASAHVRDLARDGWSNTYRRGPPTQVMITSCSRHRPAHAPDRDCGRQHAALMISRVGAACVSIGRP